MTGQVQGVGPSSLTPAVTDGERATLGTTEFGHVFETSYRPLLAYARRRVGDGGEADDVVAEVFTTAWRRRGELDPSRPPVPWLYGIAHNVVRNQWRSTQRRLRLVDKLETQPAPAPEADPAERLTPDIGAALATLSFDDQELLRLIAWDGLSHAEVGHVLACSTNAVALRLHRARQRLQHALDHPAPNDESAEKGLT